MTTDPGEVYRAGYAAFDRGDFTEAMLLGTQCLTLAAPDCYWHFGALGLRCWTANFLGNQASVERDAHTLLAEDSGTDKSWFDGLAHFNLGLVQRRAGNPDQAKALFAQASECYVTYQIRPEQPPEWALVNRLFAAVTHWAATDDSRKLEHLSAKLAGGAIPGDLTKQLTRVVDLYFRHIDGEEVTADTATATGEGVSRTFLALLLC